MFIKAFKKANKNSLPESQFPAYRVAVSDVVKTFKELPNRRRGCQIKSTSTKWRIGTTYSCSQITWGPNPRSQHCQVINKCSHMCICTPVNRASVIYVCTWVTNCCASSFDFGWINSNFEGYTSKFAQELLELIWLGLRKTISFCQTIHFWIRYCSGWTISWISKSKYSAGGGVVYHCLCIVVILVFPKLKCRKCVVHWCGGSVV